MVAAPLLTTVGCLPLWSPPTAYFRFGLRWYCEELRILQTVPWTIDAAIMAQFVSDRHWRFEWSRETSAPVQEEGEVSDRRVVMTSSCSGKRCSVCFEKINSPSTSTSNWPRPPTTMSESMPSASLIAAARLEAFGR